VAFDGDTLAVGAIYEDSCSAEDENNNACSNSGAVYVFVRTGGVWSQQQYIKASDAGTGDLFDLSVALDGDTLAVGAVFESSCSAADENDNACPRAGAVYVFLHTGAVWSQVQYIKASNAGTGPGFDGLGDRFGQSVALDGNTLAVGAIFEDSCSCGALDENNNGCANAGAVYVFVYTGVLWAQQQYIKASNAGSRARFGQSVALAGDTLAVGAYYEESCSASDENSIGCPEAGAAYMFLRTGTVWGQQQYIKASNVGTGDVFGVSIALEGNTLAVGAAGEDSCSALDENDNACLGAGAVYVFVRTGAVWSQEQYVKASNAGAQDNFGYSG